MPAGATLNLAIYGRGSGDYIMNLAGYDVGDGTQPPGEDLFSWGAPTGSHYDPWPTPFGSATTVNTTWTNTGAGRYVLFAGYMTGIWKQYVEWTVAATVTGGSSVFCSTPSPEEIAVPSDGEPGACRAQPCAADPVNVVQGNFWDTWSDAVIPGPGPGIALLRTYSSSRGTEDGPFGFGWASTYSMQVVATSTSARVVQETGAVLPFTKVGSTWAAPYRVNASLTELTSSSDRRWTLKRAGREIFTFNVSGQLTSIGTPSGEETTLTYTSGRLDLVTDGAGRQLDVDWNANGRVATVTAPTTTLRTDGPSTTMVWVYGYDASGNLSSVTAPNTGTWTFEYDGAHRMTRVVEPRHQSMGAGAPAVTNHYDVAGRVDWQDDRLGRRTTFDWATPGQTRVTDPKGNVTVYEHQDGLATGIVRNPGPDQSRWFFEVQPATLGRTKVTDPNGVVTTADYNTRGLPTRVTTPRGTTSITYSPQWQPATVTDPVATTTFSYASGTDRLTGVSRPILPGGGTWSMAVSYGDPANPGRPTSVTDARGKVWSFAYNGQADLVSATDPTGRVTTWTYNSLGWPLSTVEPAGNTAGADSSLHTTRYSYDAAANVVAITDPLGAVTEHGLDLSGYLQWVKDPMPAAAPAEQTNLTWNAAGELTVEQRPDGSTRTTEYWPDGALKTQRDGATNPTSYTYDAQGRLDTVTDPAQRTTRYGYDPAGQVTSVQQLGGNCTAAPKVGCVSREYSASGDLETIDFSDPATPDVTFEYDALGRRTSMVDQAGTSSWAWDSIGRLRSFTDPISGTVAYTFTDNGPEASSITYPGGKTIQRGFDDAGRQASVTGWTGGTTSFGYDANSNLTTTDSPATTGVEDTAGYDRANRATAHTLRQGTSVLASLGYSRDPEGMVTTTTGTGITGAADSFTYSPLDQLGTDANGAYEFDLADNLTGFPDGRRQRFNAASELCYQALTNTAACGSSPEGATTFSYDDRGNRVVKAPPGELATRYGYDQADRLVSVSDRRDGAYNALTPARVLDTRPEERTGLCPTATSQCTTIEHSATRVVQIAGQGGVPTSGVAAVFFTLSVVNPQAAGDLTVVAADATSGGGATTIGFAAGEWASTTAFVKLSADGRIAINAPWGGTDVIIDVQGWISDSSGTGSAQFTPLDSQRIMNTRAGEQSGACPTSSTQCARIPAGGTLTVQVAGQGGVPSSGATAVALNVIATGSTQGGLLQLRDASLPQGSAVSLFYIAGQTDANGHIVKLSSDGKIKIYSSADVDVLLDVQGWFGASGEGSVFTPHDATRVLDTRADTRLGACPTATSECTPIPAGGSRTVQITGRGGVPATGVTAVALNLIVIPTANGMLTVSRADTTPSGDGEIHYAAGQGVTTNVIVPVSADGRVRLDVAWGGTDALLDVQGWFTTSPPTYTYTYAGDGLRTSKTGPDGTVTRYTWDRAAGLPLLLAEAIDAPGTTNDHTVRYLHDPTGRVLADITDQAGNETLRWYHHDQLGSIRALTNTTGAVLATYTYTPYGEVMASTGTATTPFGWAGEYKDSETGFVYLRARYYDPTTAQFLTRDPLEAITRSAYGYVGNNPLNYVDPSGKFGIPILAAVAVFEIGSSIWDAYDAYRTFNDDCSGGMSRAAAGGFFLLGLFTPGSVGLTDEVVDGGARLFRFGLERESAEKLSKEAAQASAAGFPHGVSTFSRSSRPDAVSARRADVERFFPVHKTGRGRHHYTVELPATVTDEVAEIFNVLFGRS